MESNIEKIVYFGTQGCPGHYPKGINFSLRSQEYSDWFKIDNQKWISYVYEHPGYSEDVVINGVHYTAWTKYGSPDDDRGGSHTNVFWEGKHSKEEMKKMILANPFLKKQFGLKNMIYIAGPFFNETERKYLETMIKFIKSEYPDHELFIPMEHFVPDGESMDNFKWSEEVFKMDVKAIDESEFMVALYLGHYSDTGTAWEIGYAYAKGIPVKLWIPEDYQDQNMSIMPIQSCSNKSSWKNLIQK